MDQETILELLNLGEHERLEYKAAGGGVPKSIWETYSSFANTYGGTILLGVEETKEPSRPPYRIVGVRDAQSQIRDIWNTVNNREKVNKNILSSQDVGITRIDDADVVWIQVPALTFAERPVYCGRNPLTGIYKRNHEGDYRCTEDEVRRMYRDSTPNGDSRVLPDYTLDDLDAASVAAYRTQFQLLHPGHTWNGLSDGDFLRMLRVWADTSQSSTACLTMAGLLMFGKSMAVQRAFPAIRLDYIDTTNSTPEVRWRDRVVFDGTWEYNLFNFATIVLPKITRDIAKQFQLNGVIRQDDTPVHKAVREALINMLVHCDYHACGVAVATKDDNGFSFRNPGTPLMPVSDVYAGGTTSTRNPQIQIIFRLIGFGESIGSGFPMILHAWRGQGWRLPDLSENRSVLTTDLRLWTLPVTSAELENEASQTVNGYKDLPEAARHIVTTLLAERSATTDRIARVIGKPRSSALQLLTDLSKNQILCQDIGDKWSLLRQEPTSGRIDTKTAKWQNINQRICAEIHNHERMTTRQIADATGYSVRTIQRSLKRLLDSKAVGKVRSGNSVLYFLAEPYSTMPGG